MDKKILIAALALVVTVAGQTTTLAQNNAQKLEQSNTLSQAQTNAQAQTHRLDIQAQKLGAPVQSTMYGIFFEDINFAADGGLYAELVKNRSFEFPNALQGWKVAGQVEVRTEGPAYERNPHYVRLSFSGHREHWTALENEGFFGMGVEQGKQYRFTVTARAPHGEKAVLRVALVNTRTTSENHYLSRPQEYQDVEITSTHWQKYTITLTPTETCERANLRIMLVGSTAVDLDHVSLFPKDTFNGHENGLRKDLAQALADLHPGIFRFPGGCIVEGTTLDERYNWKNSVGPVENRPLNKNRWLDTFPFRMFPDYYQSYGLGFYEFFQLCEEIGSEPLPIISVGLACQFQNDISAHAPIDKLQPFVQDALDLIEFANGDASTTWGKVRAEMGHPAPFHLKFLGIGNEQWGPEYPERLKVFVDALRKAHPEIKLVGSAGPNAEGEQFDYLWEEMTRLKADLVDEHFYRPAEWFLAQGNRYNNYDHRRPKVFAGEYACHISGNATNHFYPALMEAAFMTGIERNADLVHMATYAPLFAHVEGWQWRPDLIWFDNLRVARTCSYYVQQLYATHKGTNVLSLKMNGKPVAGNADQDGLFASAVFDANTGEYIVKVVNTSATEQPIALNFAFKKKQSLTTGKVIELASPDLTAENTVDAPNRIKPAENAIAVSGNSVEAQIPAYSFQVYILK